jgi:integrase
MRDIHIEQLSDHSFSARIVNPITGKRQRITDDSEVKIRARVKALADIASSLRLGLIGQREAERDFNLRLKGAPLVSEMWDDYVQVLHGPHAENTKGAWNVRLAPYFGKARVYELTPEVMAQWERSELHKGASPKTIQNAFWSLKAAIRSGIPHRVQELPWRNWRPRPKPSGDEEEVRESCRNLNELRALVRAAIAYDEDVVARSGYSDAATRILFLVLSGCRQSEAAALGWDNVLFDHAPPELRIWYATKPRWKQAHPDWLRPFDSPKMNKRRTQTMHPHMVEELRLHRERQQRMGYYRPDGPVFPGVGGAWRLVPRVMENDTFREIVELAGLPNPEKWVVHSTRHTFGTLESFGSMVTTGDVRGAMIRGGWTKVETMLGYMKKAGRGRPESFIGELPQGELPGLQLGPSGSELRRLRAATDREAAALVELAQGSVVREVSKTEASLTLAQLAQRYPDEVPRVIRARAKHRYSRGYQQAKRDGKNTEQCRAAGLAASKGFLAKFHGMQKINRDKTPKNEGES